MRLLTLTLVRKSIVCLFLLLFGVMAQAATSPWPMYQHDPQHTGRSTATGPATNVKKWECAKLSQPPIAPPIIDANGIIYEGLSDGTLYAINPDGTPKLPTPAFSRIFTGSPAIAPDGTTLYIGTQDGHLYNIPSTWAYPSSGAIGKIDASVTVDADGTSYFGAEDGVLYAVDKTGKMKWKFDTSPGTDHSITTTPAIGTDGTIYIANSAYFNNYPHFNAINSDGTKKWSQNLNKCNTSIAIDSSGNLYYGTTDGTLVALDSTGTQNWTFPIPSSGNATSPAIGANGTIFCGSSDKNLYAISPAGLKMWASPVDGAITGAPVIDASGTIYITTDDALYAINPTDGSQKWVFTGKQDNYFYQKITMPIMGADGTIYFGCTRQTYTSGSKTTADYVVFAIGPGGGVPTNTLSAPTLLTPANNAAGVATPTTFSWSAVTSATVYALQVASDANFNTVVATKNNLTTLTDTETLTTGSTYYWHVKAGDGTKWSSYSTAWSFTVGTTTPALTPPTLLTPADSASNLANPVNFTWSAVTGATAYMLQVATDYNFSKVVVSKASLTTVSDTETLPINTTFYWRVKAGDGTNWSASSTTRAFTTATGTPSITAPTLLTPTNGATGVATPSTLSWNPVTGAVSYTLQFAKDAGFTTGLVTRNSLTTTTDTESNLSAGATYYWRVLASDGTNQSPYSTARSFTIAAPTTALNFTVKAGIFGTEGPSADQFIADCTPGVFYLTIYNTGNVATRYVIASKPTIQTGWYLHIFTPDGTRDFVRNFLSQGWTTPSIPAGGSIVYRLEVTPTSGVAIGAVQDVPLTAKIVGSSATPVTVTASTTVIY